jgi:hypothetical protein
MDDWTVPTKVRELLQQLHSKQGRLATELGVELLPRYKDRILKITWGDTPLAYDQPRFGAFETRPINRSRGGWLVTLSQALQYVEPPILDWVLWREALLSFLLPHLRRIPEAGDLGLYAGLQYGDYTKLEREALDILWKQVSPPQHYQHYIYDASFGFPLFDQVVTGTFLHRAIPWLNTLRPTTTHNPLATSTYTAALERWMLETHIPLTQTEHHVITALNSLTTPLHQSRLASKLKMSISGLSQQLTTLAQRYLLRFIHFINLPLVGLIPYEIIIHTPNQKNCQRVVSIFSQIPYTWFINQIPQTSLHCRVFIPHNHVGEFNTWLNELKTEHDPLSLSAVRTSDIVQAWNLGIYIPEKGWSTDFTFLLHKIQSILDYQIEESLPAFSLSTMSYEMLENNKQFPLPLRPEDFTYFLRAADVHQITDRIISQPSKELREAGITETAHMVYRRRIRFLEKKNVSSVKGMWMMHLGLNTIIQIYLFEDRETTLHLLEGLQLFPQLNALILENGNGVIFLYVPTPLAVDILSFLRKIFATKDLNALVITKPTWQSSSGFDYPVQSKNYDFERKEWKWERSTLPIVSR